MNGELKNKKISILKIIIKIKNSEQEGIFDLLKKYVHKNISEFNNNPEQLVIILREIAKKFEYTIEYTVYKLIERFYNEKKYSEKILDILTPFFDKKTWNYISMNRKLSEKFVEKHADKINWNLISQNPNISEQFIEKFVNKLDLVYISSFRKLSEEFIEKHADKVNWNIISIYQKLSENFIEKHADKVNWELVSMFQTLSEKFIEQHANKVNWNKIFYCQKLSEEFKKKHEWRNQ